VNLFTEHFGLDLGTHSIKLVALDADPGNGAGYRLAEALVQPLPTGLIGGDCTKPCIGDFAALREIIQKMVARVRGRRDSLILGLPDRWIKLHLLEMTLKPNELDPGFLSWRLRKQLCPAELGAVVLDHQIVSAQADGDNVNCWVMAGILQEEMLEQISRLFAGLRLQLMAIDSSTLGVANLYAQIRGDQAEANPVIFCHLGHETSVVKAYDSGQLHYERVIEGAGDAFTTLLADALGLTAVQAADEKHKRCFFPADRADIVRMIPERAMFMKVFGNWLRELHVTFKFYQDKFKVQKLPPLYLTGGSSLFAGLAPFLADYFDTPCEVFNGLAPFLGSAGGAAAGAGAAPGDPRLALGPLLTPCLGLLVN